MQTEATKLFTPIIDTNKMNTDKMVEANKATMQQIAKADEVVK